MRTLLIFLLSLAALPAASIPAAAEVINSIAAIVNDEPITRFQVEKEMAPFLKEAEKKGAVTPETRQQLRTAALNQLIDKHLVDQKIKELNIRVSEEEVRQSIEEIKKQNNLSQDSLVAALTAQGLTFDQYRAQFREQLERLRLMSQEVRSKIQVGEREMMDYYKANQTRFGGEDLFHARQIFFGLGKDPSPQKTKETMAAALNVLNEARSGKDFAELAKKHSTDPRAATDGGDLGTFKRGEMLPEVDEALAGMRPGDISDVIISPAGLHIIKLETRSSAPVKPFEQVKGEIEELLYKKKSDERFNQWLEDLRKNAAIEIRNDEK